MKRKSKAETAVVAEVKGALEHLPDVSSIVRVQSGVVQVRRGWMHLAPEGTPDLMGHLDTGIHLEVEVKVPGEQTSPAQDAHLARSRKAGACAFVAESGVDAIKAVLAFKRGGVAALPALPGDARPAPTRKPRTKKPAVAFRGKQEEFGL